MQKFLLLTSLFALGTTVGAVDIEIRNIFSFGGISKESGDMSSNKIQKVIFDPYKASRQKKSTSSLAYILDPKLLSLEFNTFPSKIPFPTEEEKAFPFVNHNMLSEDIEIPASTTSTVLEIGDEEIVELFTEALAVQQNASVEDQKDILEYVFDILSQAPIAPVIEEEERSEQSVVTKTASSTEQETSELSVEELADPREVSASITSGESEDTVSSKSSILMPPKAPMPPLNAPIFTAKTAKKIMSIADIIRESLSGAPKLRSTSGASKNPEAEEITFDLGAMGKVSGKEVSLLAARMAKLRAAADANSRPETYGTQVEKPSVNSRSSSKTTTAPLSWNKTRPSTSKFTLKRTALTGKAMSLAEMLAGGVQLKSTSGTQRSVSKDPKEAFKDDLKNALNGGLKLKSVVKDTSLSENEATPWASSLKKRTDSPVDDSSPEAFLSDNPILQKMRAKALEREETLRKAEEEERVRLASISLVAAPVKTPVEEVLGKQVITPVITPLTTPNETGSGDMFSSLKNALIKFNFDQDKDSSVSTEEDDEWDDEDNSISSSGPSEKIEPKKEDEPKKVTPSTTPSKLKLKAGKGGDLLAQIRAQRKLNDEVQTDQEKIRQALEAEENRQAERAKLKKEREEAERKAEIEKMKALKSDAKIEEDDVASGFKQILAMRKSIAGNEDDEDGDD